MAVDKLNRNWSRSESISGYLSTTSLFGLASSRMEHRYHHVRRWSSNCRSQFTHVAIMVTILILTANPCSARVYLGPCDGPNQGYFAPYIKRLVPLAVMNPASYTNDQTDDDNQAFSSYKFATCPVCPTDEGGKLFSCNETAAASICQLSAFQWQNSAYKEVRPLDNSPPQQITLAEPTTTWNCAVDDDPNSIVWHIEKTSISANPYYQQNALLQQAQSFLNSIASMQALFVDATGNQKLCESLKSMGMDIDACENTTNRELIENVTIPIIDSVINESSKNIVVHTRLNYNCKWGFQQEALIDFVHYPTSTAQTDQFSLEIGIAHECCCQNATESCRAGYKVHKEQREVRDQCSNLETTQKTILEWAALVVVLAIWVVEWIETGRHFQCESLTRHPKFILKDLLFFTGIISPINFMENRKGSLIIACIFGALASLIFREVMAPTGETFWDATVYLALLYPMFICRACHNNFLGSMFGAIYCIPFTFFMWLQVGCRGLGGQSDLALYNLIPALCCNVFVGWFGYQFYRRLPCLIKSRARSPSKRSIWYNYDHRAIVHGLLQTTRKERSISRVKPRTFLHRWWFRNVLDLRKAFLHFRYSPRMLAMVSMSLCMLFQFVVYFSYQFYDYSIWVEGELSGGLCCNGIPCAHNDRFLWQKWTANSTTVSLDSVREALNIKYDNCDTNKRITDALFIVLMLASVLMALLHVVSVFNMITCYRKHMMRFYKGDKQFLSKFEPGPYIALTDALKYASYQVIFVISGYVFSTVLVAALFLFVAYTVILPAQGLYPDLFWPWVYEAFIYDPDTGLGMLTITIVLWVAMMAMVWFCFLDRSVYMAIQNRIFWDTFDLFQTIANFLVGFFMFIKRLLVQILFGVLFISRLDKPLVPRGYEAFDPGFACYQGFLMVELYYSNPVMLTFIQLLVDGQMKSKTKAENRISWTRKPKAVRRRKKNGSTQLLADDEDPDNDDEFIGADALTGPKKCYKRWQLLLTLINNPELVHDRRHGDEPKKKQKKQKLASTSQPREFKTTAKRTLRFMDTSSSSLGPSRQPSQEAMSTDEIVNDRVDNRGTIMDNLDDDDLSDLELDSRA